MPPPRYNSGGKLGNLNPITITVIVLATAAVITMTATFLRSHQYLLTAVTEHGKSYKFHAKPEGDWQAIYSLAVMSKDSAQFIQKLKLEGFMAGASANGTSDIRERPDLDMATKWSRRGAARKIEPGRKDDYGQDTNVYESGPHDAQPEEGDYWRGKNSTSSMGVGARTNTALASPVSDPSERAEFELEDHKDSRAQDYQLEDKKVKREKAAAEEEEEEEEGGVDAAILPMDGNPPPMSERLAQKLAVNNTVIVTWANYALWDFVKSWARHVQKLGITNILVGAMDAEIGKALVDAGINSFAMYEPRRNNNSGVGSSHLAWGGEGFHKMGRQKISLAQMFLGYKLNLLLVDVDVVILRNVMEYFDRTPEADILVSSDLLATTLPPKDEGLEIPSNAGAPMNIGIMYFRYSPVTLQFVNSWLDAINAKPDYWDQNAFNDLARAGWDPYTKLHPKNKRVFQGYNGTLHVGVLPVALFSGGHTFYIQRLYEVQQVQPYAVHCTFQYGANAGKRNRMREAMVFEDDEEYYTGDNYIMSDVRRMPSMGVADFAKLNYTEKKQYNVKGLDMQLESIYPTIGLSLMFNRSMIMPKIACYCDRYWTPLDDCRVPGAKQQRLPFVCPMDYVLDPINLVDKTSTLQVKWRESSFLENTRCPESVKRSKLTIYTSSKHKKPAERYNVQDGGTVLFLPSATTTKKLVEVLQPYAGYKVWHFRDAAATFKGFDEPLLQSAYQQRILHLKPVVQPMKE